jgi:demethylmenaquinone methyltransferase / 2-methoxy-6-polyprenyl-1,4-benzoquinol methylase
MSASDNSAANTTGAAKRAYVRGVFTAIAPRYDLLNHLLSLNVDRRWRRQAVKLLGWERMPKGIYLDLCAGTLDLAATLAGERGFAGRIVGADFVLPMLQRGRNKSAAVIPLNADALELPFSAASFDGATVGFGVRNLADLDQGLRESARVLKPGAKLVVLEFTTPTWQPMRGLYLAYFRRILPLVGRLVSKHTTAYTYLPESVLNFPAPAALADRMRMAGFSDVSYETLFGGVCALHAGVRSSEPPTDRGTSYMHHAESAE